MKADSGDTDTDVLQTGLEAHLSTLPETPFVQYFNIPNFIYLPKMWHHKMNALPQKLSTVPFLS